MPTLRHMIAVAFCLLSLNVLQAAEPPLAISPSEAPSPNWIWGPNPSKENEDVYFRRIFDPGITQKAQIKSAVLWASCDDSMTVFINGMELGRLDAWQEPLIKPAIRPIEPGRNVIAVRAHNISGIAGMILKLEVTLTDGKKFDIVSDGSWKTAPEAGKDWENVPYDDSAWKLARIVGPYGASPWGTLPKNGAAAIVGKATPAEALTLLPGFKAELLYSVPKATQGSWVSMTPDPQGRLIVSAQDGPMYRVTPSKSAADTKVEPLNVDVGGAQGLLYAFDSLYVSVNGAGIGGHPSGLYRLRYHKETDSFGPVEELAALTNRTGDRSARTEHGPHAIRLGPDGKLYLTAGNFTAHPKPLSPNSPFKNWAEDLLLPRNPDGNGHDPTIWAPGGWVCRTDPDGKEWEFVLGGLRNSYDFDFSPDGEMFLYDSDMEWDTGTPWYRPTRILLGVSGGEYGWRNGTGKWPEYYPDSLGAVANTGLASPTGVTFGTGAKFPLKYQRALYGMDWAYGRVYAFHLVPQGAGFTATYEPFITGKAFNVTDIVINHDGAMYITIGGRGTQSGLYRITYTQPVTATQAPPPPPDAVKVRHHLESFHGHVDSAAVSESWPYLNSPDRYLRFAARVAIEAQPVAQWQEQALSEKRPTALINAMVALARYGDKSLEPRMIEALNQLPLKQLSEEQLLEAFRAYGLAFIRMGKPDASTCATLAAHLDPLYPAASFDQNRELSQLLVYLGSPTVIEKTMKLLAAAPTQEEQLHYVLVLRVVDHGWTIAQRKAYFSWLSLAEKTYRGGASFRRFLIRIREDAIGTLTENEKAELGPFLKGLETVPVVKVTKPRQFVKNWQMDDLLPSIEQATHGRSFEKGKAAYEAVGCAACHRFNNEGGSTGPDLTGVGNRFSPADVLESILLPSKVISDQYQTTEIVTRGHDIVAGRIEAEDADKIVVRTNPLSDQTVTIRAKDIVSRHPSKISMMPEGLVDTLGREEIMDLVAYLRSGGNASDAAFH